MSRWHDLRVSGASDGQGFNFRPVQPNRRAPVPVYRSGLAGYRSEPVELNLNFAVQPVRTGIPVGWTGLPAGLAGLPVGLTGN